MGLTWEANSKLDLLSRGPGGGGIGLGSNQRDLIYQRIMLLPLLGCLMQARWQLQDGRILTLAQLR